jgi:6-pyruvoyltetrahydropterin/6-carboxytetrahydropterin synthase
VFELTVEGHFSAAHNLRNFKGRCENLHGHNWKVEVVVRGDRLDQADLVMDFGDLKKLMNASLDKLDHRHLNEIAPFDECNPSSELIAKYLYQDVARGLPPEVSMHKVNVWESPGSKATYFE